LLFFKLFFIYGENQSPFFSFRDKLPRFIAKICGKPMNDQNDNNENNKLPERPLECGECKRPIYVRYTEIVGDNMTETIMCSECPVLRRKLYGQPHIESTDAVSSGSMGLACGNCGTTLDAVRVGTPLGCSHCYEVFEDIIISELFAADKIPARLSGGKKAHALHVGRTLGEVPEISPSARLLALNEALSETLKKEDYEQAAWLRDQIKALTESPEKNP
jgi:protein arginine kinase activator